VADPEKKADVLLYQVLAPQLAEALHLPGDKHSYSSLNRVACEYLLSGKPRKPIYVAMCELLDKFNKLNPAPPSALCDVPGSNSSSHT
jgi:hypothetical protein